MDQPPDIAARTNALGSGLASLAGATNRRICTALGRSSAETKISEQKVSFTFSAGI
jgi:hypothetical protein